MRKDIVMKINRKNTRVKPSFSQQTAPKREVSPALADTYRPRPRTAELKSQVQATAPPERSSWGQALGMGTLALSALGGMGLTVLAASPAAACDATTIYNPSSGKYEGACKGDSLQYNPSTGRYEVGDGIVYNPSTGRYESGSSTVYNPSTGRYESGSKTVYNPSTGRYESGRDDAKAIYNPSTGKYEVGSGMVYNPSTGRYEVVK